MTSKGEMMPGVDAGTLEDVKPQVTGSAEAMPPLAKLVASLNTTSVAMATFCSKFYQLERHLHSIQSSIDRRAKQLHGIASDSQQDILPNSDPSAVLNSTALDQLQDSRFEVEQLNENMSGKGLRKHVVSHLAEVDALREEVCNVLRKAPDPVRLVLDCIGGFYLQGRKAFTKDSPMIPGRQASILVLEFFLFSGCSSSSKMTKPLKSETENIARAWRSRLVREGGIPSCSEPDALGLLLFVVAFGIPSAFDHEDLYYLIRLSNVQKKSDVLRSSSALVERIEVVIQGMVKDGKPVAAVALSCAFKLEDKFPPISLLSSFVQTHLNKRPVKNLSLKASHERQIAALKLVKKCVGDHNLNCAEVVGWKLGEKITNLNESIDKLRKRVNERNLKKADELGLSPRNQLTVNNASYSQPLPVVMPSQDRILHDRPLPNPMFEDRPGLFNAFSDTSIKSGVALPDSRGMGGPISGDVFNAFSGHGSRYNVVPVMPDQSAGIAGPYDGYGVGSSMVNSGRTSAMERDMQYGWRENSALKDASVGRSILNTHSLTAQSFPVSSQQGSSPSKRYKFADTLLQRESHHGSSHKDVAAPGYHPYQF